MLNGRQGSTSAEIKEPDHTHTLTHAEGSADVLQMPQMIQGRESELLYRHSAKHLHVSAV